MPSYSKPFWRLTKILKTSRNQYQHCEVVKGPSDRRSSNDFSLRNRSYLDEFTIAIKFSKNMKAPGFDAIFNIVLKNFGPKPKALSLLVKLFYRCLEWKLPGYFPSMWKRSKVVVAIAKPGKEPTLSSSYRPVSLLSSKRRIGCHRSTLKAPQRSCTPDSTTTSSKVFRSHCVGAAEEFLEKTRKRRSHSR